MNTPFLQLAELLHVCLVCHLFIQTVKIRYKNVQVVSGNNVQCTGQWLIVPETIIF
jgi:hypothetical protein